MGIVRDYMTGAHDGALQLCRSRIEELDLPATTPTHSMHIDYPETGASISAIGALRRGANLRELETYTLIWFEESQTHSQDTLTTVAIKVRLPGSRMVYTFNPTWPDDPVLILAQNPPPKTRCHFVNWWDNRHFTPELESERSQMEARGDPDYAHRWDGKLRSAQGKVFNAGALREVDASHWPDAEKRVRAWDCAATEGAGDWTVGVRIAMRGGEFLIEDVRRDRLGPAGVDDLIKTTASGDGFDTLIREEQEPGSSGKSVVDARSRMLPGYQYLGVASTGPKVARANAFASAMGNGLVCVPRGAPWLPAFRLEYAAFTADNSHQHDDQVDAGSLGFNSLTQEVEPTPWVPTVL